MKRIGFLMVCVVFGFSLTHAQSDAGFSVSETIHDFGSIYEEDGDATCEFIITNTGNAPLELTRVTASCGCTTPEWTRTPIEPGKKGVVKATYGAKGRPGKFEKTISIYTNVQEAPFVVKIKGEVLSQKPTVDLQVKQPEIVAADPKSAPNASNNVTQKKEKAVAQEGKSAAGSTYTVKSGDTLEKISKKTYGTAGKVNDIMQKNNIKSKNSLRVGQVIELP